MHGNIKNRNRKTNKKFEEKRIQMTSLEKIREICGKQNENCQFKVKTLKRRCTAQQKMRRFAGLVDEVMPAGCGLDFEGISSPQSPVITARMYRNRNGVVGRQHGRLYRNLHGE